MIQPGSKIAHYEIVSALGKGGMGEVHRARDSKLGREVAIKVLPKEFAQDEDRLARLDREARMLAALNHPNIAAIYGLEEHDGSRFLVLELVEGDTLADRLAKGPIPVGEALKLALQVAHALETAHEKGVIHRDLKPANIKVTPDGKVKVLDFGLAKAFAGEGADPNLSQSPTLSLAATRQGIILGTAGYMSPEQARGEETDKRADVWAFGCVLFEMLTGRGTFDGRTVSDVLASVLAKDPQWDELPHNLHPRLRMLLERCLEKDIKDRYGSISDARVDIESVLADPAGPIVVAGSVAEPVPQSKLAWVAALAGVALVAALGGWALKPASTTEPEEVIRFYRDFPSLGSGAISPDGRRIAYRTTAGELYLWETDEFAPRPIPGVEPSVAGAPAFSPDGQSIAYVDGVRRQIQKIDVGGGLPVPIADVDQTPRMSWGPNGVIVYAAGGALMSVSANGGVPQVLLEYDSDQQFITVPMVLPDGSVLFTTLVRAEDVVGAESRVEVLPPGAAEAEVLFDTGADGVAQYSPTGHIVYDAAGTLFARPFDLATRTVGNAVPVIEGVGRDFFIVTASGTLVYGPGLTERPLVWVDRSGTAEQVRLPIADYGHPRVSPDGTRVVVDQLGTDRNMDIWVYDLDRGSSTRLTRDPAAESDPIWMGDESVVFSRAGPMGGLFRTSADGSGEIERLIESSENRMMPFSVDADGSALIFVELDARTGDNDIRRFVPGGDSTDDVLASTEFSEMRPALSPDHRLIAYQSNESGSAEIYVRPYPDVAARRWTISTDGGQQPLWAPDGGELFYRSGRGGLMRVPVAFDGDAPVFGTPERLFEDTFIRGGGRSYDIHPDGDRFLMLSRNDVDPDSETTGTAGVRLSFVIHWDQELLERVPVD